MRAALIAVLAAAAVLSLGVGHYAMPLPEVAKTIGGTLTDTLDAQGRISQAMLFQVRLPRIVLAGLVGAALAASGASYQGIMKNPLVGRIFSAFPAERRSVPSSPSSSGSAR